MANPLAQVMLGCLDLERAIEFYGQTLGFELIAKFDPPGLAFFDLAGVRLLLERGHASRSSSSALYFSVPDIAQRYEALLRKGVRFESKPHLIHVDTAGAFGPPGCQEWMAFFRDPDENVLALVERRLQSSVA